MPGCVDTHILHAQQDEKCPCNSGRFYENCCLDADKRTSKMDQFKHIGIIFGGSDIYGKARPLQEAIDHIKDIPLWWVLQELTSIQILLANERESRANPLHIEEAFRSRFFDKTQRAKIASFEKTQPGRCTALCWQQLLLAIEIACTVCKNTANNVDSWHDSASRLGKFILAVNDFFAKHDTISTSDSLDRIANLKSTTATLIKKQIAGHGDELRYMLPRAWLVFVGFHEENSNDYFDIDDLLQESFGYSFVNLMELLFLLHSYWGHLRVDKWDEKSLKINPENAFSNFSTENQKLFLSAIKTLARKADQISLPDFESQDWDRYIYSFFEGKGRPLIEHDGVYYCTTPDFIQDAIWLWPYYTVMDSIKNESDKNRFFRFIGKSFEFYIQSLLKSCFKDKFVQITTGVNGNPLNDGAVFINQDTLIVFEIKKYRPTNSLSINGTPITDSQDFQKHLFDGFQQLSVRIEEYLSTSKFKGKVIPFLVTLGFVPTHPQIWELMNTRLNELFLYQSPQVEFPIISDPIGIEIFTAAVSSGYSASEILEKRHGNSMWRQGVFKDFLLEAFFKEDPEPLNMPLLSLFEDIIGITAGRFGSKKLPRHSPTGLWKDVFPGVPTPELDREDGK